MKRMILILTILYGLGAEACPFAGLSMTEIRDGKNFTVEDWGLTRFPKVLIQSQTQILGEMNSQECEFAFVQEKITDNRTGKVYSAFRSSIDDCDGGNSYGLIIRGLKPLKEKIIATIQDSDLYCVDQKEKNPRQ